MTNLFFLLRAFCVLMFLLLHFVRCFTQEQRYEWGSPRLIPVDLNVSKNRIVLKAGGQQVEFWGQMVKLDADEKINSTWSVKKNELTTVTLKLFAEKEVLLKKVTWFYGEWKKYSERKVHATNIMDNVLFFRKNGVSFFISLDFPYSKIDSSGIHYPPNLILEKGMYHEAHSVTIGACRLSGEYVGNFDRAEVEAVSSYVEKRYPPRIQRPMVLSASITNQMTDVRDNRIFYSMYDNPTVALNPHLVEEDLKLNAELGIEYYQVFEGVFDWPDAPNVEENLMELQSMAKSLNVKMGDYAVPQGLYCPHFNYSGRKLERPDWLIVKKDRQTGSECLGVAEYTRILKDRLIQHNRKHGLQMICFDFLDIEPCYASEHLHPPGDVYQQVKGLVDVMSALNSLSDNFLVWSNSGNWIDLMPKLVWYNPNVYLTDPHIRNYAPHLNILKILGDGRREQMVSVHENFFVPYSNFTNYEYYLAPNSRVSDTKVFEYSFLQGLAVTPNIGLGEIRSFLNRISSKDEKQVKKFIKFWLSFVREHYDVWKNTSRLGDLPGLGAAEVYGHIKEDAGFLCLVNQNAFPVTKKIVLNNLIGLTSGNSFLLKEIYPGSGSIVEQRLPFSRRNDTLHLVLDPYSVRIIEIKNPGEISYPAIYGADIISTEVSEDGYKIKLSIPQGMQKELKIVVPPGEFVTSVTAFQNFTVSMYTFPVVANLVSREANVAGIVLQGPREVAPKALTRWKVDNDSSFTTFPSADIKGFLGAYVHNAFSENYKITVAVKTVKGKTPTDILRPSLESAESKSLVKQVGSSRTATYRTTFVLPFIERYGQDRNVDDDAIVELGFSDPNEIKIKAVWLNDHEVPLMVFRNAKDARHITHYVELKGNVIPGVINLKLDIEYLK